MAASAAQTLGFRIVLLGDSDVGKSCLLLRYDQDSYEESFIKETGLDYRERTVQIDGKTVCAATHHYHHHYDDSDVALALALALALDLSSAIQRSLLWMFDEHHIGLPMWLMICWCLILLLILTCNIGDASQR
jgi:GTPase SAR1 family protein